MGSNAYAYFHENATSYTFADANFTARVTTDPSGGWFRELVRSPDWPELWDQLRWAWQLHVYGMACLFLGLACASFFTVLGLRAQLSTKPHLSSLNVFLCLLGVARSLALFIDPYDSKQTIPLVMSRILWDLGYPCLLSAFALLQLSFLRMARLRMPSSRLSGESAASVIVTSHFCLIIMSDILWALRNSFRIVWLLTQVIFVLWGLFLCLTFLCGCLRLLKSVIKLPLHFLTQVETGYEIKGFLPMGNIVSNGYAQRQDRREQPQIRLTSSDSNNRRLNPDSSPIHWEEPGPSDPSRLGPKIRITDDNDQTYSYVSEGSPAQRSSGNNPLKPFIAVESSQRIKKCEIVQDFEEPAVTRPLMNDRDRLPSHSLTDESLVDPDRILTEIRRSGPATISAMQKSGSFIQRSVRVTTTQFEDFKFDARKLKPKRRSRLEKLLRKLVVTSALGIMLCLLRAYDVFGPHGLSAQGRRHAAVLPWFCFQTISRLVEFLMACFMGSITRQSLHNHCYHYCGGAKKYRDPFYYLNS